MTFKDCVKKLLMVSIGESVTVSNPSNELSEKRLIEGSEKLCVGYNRQVCISNHSVPCKNL